MQADRQQANQRTLGNAQAFLLHLKHRLDDQRRTHGLHDPGAQSHATLHLSCVMQGLQGVEAACLEDEAERKCECWRHAEDGDGNPAVEESLDHAGDEQQAHGAAAHLFKYLRTVCTALSVQDLLSAVGWGRSHTCCQCPGVKCVHLGPKCHGHPLTGSLQEFTHCPQEQMAH